MVDDDTKRSVHMWFTFTYGLLFFFIPFVELVIFTHEEPTKH